jgi:preprotein translocase subunit SecG
MNRFIHLGRPTPHDALLVGRVLGWCAITAGAIGIWLGFSSWSLDAALCVIGGLCLIVLGILQLRESTPRQQTVARWIAGALFIGSGAWSVFQSSGRERWLTAALLVLIFVYFVIRPAERRSTDLPDGASKPNSS